MDVARITSASPLAASSAFERDGDALVARRPNGVPDRLAVVKKIAEAALVEMQGDAAARLQWCFSDLTLHREALAFALSEWTDTTAPVHDLIAFDLGATPMRSRGLAWFCGQEIEVDPPTANDRRRCAHLLVNLAHDMLIGGPYRETVRADAPDLPGGEVLLRVSPGLVEIVFHSE